MRSTGDPFLWRGHCDHRHLCSATAMLRCTRVRSTVRGFSLSAAFLQNLANMYRTVRCRGLLVSSLESFHQSHFEHMAESFSASTVDPYSAVQLLLGYREWLSERKIYLTQGSGANGPSSTTEVSWPGQMITVVYRNECRNSNYVSNALCLRHLSQASFLGI